MENIALKDIKTQMMADRDSLEVRIFFCAAPSLHLTACTALQEEDEVGCKGRSIAPSRV